MSDNELASDWKRFPHADLNPELGPEPCINCDGPLGADGLCPECNADTPKPDVYKVWLEVETYSAEQDEYESEPVAMLGEFTDLSDAHALWAKAELAYNAHDGLLAALEDVGSELHRYCNGASESQRIGTLKTALRELRDDVRVALASAKGE